jgi:Lar family restriction alleviation protein
MTGETDVKTCPFCGGVARLMREPERGGHNEAPASVRISCTKCGALGPSFDETNPNRTPRMHYAIKAALAWNKRA